MQFVESLDDFPKKLLLKWGMWGWDTQVFNSETGEPLFPCILGGTLILDITDPTIAKFSTEHGNFYIANPVVTIEGRIYRDERDNDNLDEIEEQIKQQESSPDSVV